MAESDITETTGCNAIDASEMCGGHSQMEAEKSKEEIHSELLDMETRFNHFKNKLLQEVKDLTIRDKLKEQLICELLKTESFAQEKNQLYEAKVLAMLAFGLSAPAVLQSCGLECLRPLVFGPSHISPALSHCPPRSSAQKHSTTGG